MHNDDHHLVNIILQSQYNFLYARDDFIVGTDSPWIVGLSSTITNSNSNSRPFSTTASPALGVTRLQNRIPAVWWGEGEVRPCTCHQFILGPPGETNGPASTPTASLELPARLPAENPYGYMGEPTNSTQDQELKQWPSCFHATAPTASLSCRPVACYIRRNCYFIPEAQ